MSILYMAVKELEGWNDSYIPDSISPLDGQNMGESGRYRAHFRDDTKPHLVGIKEFEFHLNKGEPKMSEERTLTSDRVVTVNTDDDGEVTTIDVGNGIELTENEIYELSAICDDDEDD